jgi:hypothetical protein
MQELYSCPDLQSANELYEEILKDFARNIVIYRSGNSLELWMRSYNSVSKCFLWIPSKLDADLRAAYKASTLDATSNLILLLPEKRKRRKESKPNP